MGAHVCQRIDIANRRVSVIRSPVALVRLKVDRPHSVGPKMSEEAKVDDTPRCPIGGQSEASPRAGLLENPVALSEKHGLSNVNTATLSGIDARSLQRPAMHPPTSHN